MIKQYNSFEEIDNQLKILKLQREINKESLKLNLKHSKIDLTSLNVISSFNSYIQMKMITWITKNLRRYLNKIGLN
jgi:hypothetical protein